MIEITQDLIEKMSKMEIGDSDKLEELINSGHSVSNTIFKLNRDTVLKKALRGSNTIIYAPFDANIKLNMKGGSMLTGDSFIFGFKCCNEDKHADTWFIRELERNFFAARSLDFVTPEEKEEFMKLSDTELEERFKSKLKLTSDTIENIIQRKLELKEKGI